jgi:hypothetical protein
MERRLAPEAVRGDVDTCTVETWPSERTRGRCIQGYHAPHDAPISNPCYDDPIHNRIIATHLSKADSQYPAAETASSVTRNKHPGTPGRSTAHPFSTCRRTCHLGCHHATTRLDTQNDRRSPHPWQAHLDALTAWRGTTSTALTGPARRRRRKYPAPPCGC